MEEATRKKPGPAPRISREDVVATARRLHAEGRLTMTAISDELGVTVGALYRYVPDKAAILSLLAVEERNASGLPDSDLSWADWLDATVRGDAQFWGEHPHMASVSSISAPTQPGLQSLDQALRILTDAGLAPLDAVVASTFASYVSFGLGMSDRSRVENLHPETGADVKAILEQHGIDATWAEIRERLVAVVQEWVEGCMQPG